MQKWMARDFYETAVGLTEALCYQEAIAGKKVCEPCAGNRAIANILIGKGCTVEASDITDGMMFDATREEFWVNRNFEWVIVMRSLQSDIPRVAVLLRLSFFLRC
jgi:hypothetical protein